MLEKITILGGSGFVGTSLCQLLKDKQKNFEIIDLKISKKFPDNCKIGDVRDIDSLRRVISGQILINLAAIHKDDIRDKADYQRTNILGAQNVAKVCEEKGIKKIIFTSSVAVYGFAEAGTDETGLIQPFNEYGRTKFEAEEIMRSWNEDENNSLIIVRPTVIFGEGNRGNVYNLFNQIASGKFVMIGNGKNYKSMAYIRNVVEFLNVCIETNQKYGIYNYVDTPDLSMNELVSIVQKKLKNKLGVGIRIPYWIGITIGYIADIFSLLTGRSLLISSIRVKKFISSTAFCSSKNKLENFQPPFTISEGILRTLESEFVSPDPNREIFFTE